MVAPALPYSKGGRPSDYSVDVAEQICLRIASGESVRSISRDETMPAMSTIFLWLSKHEEFSERYGVASEARMAAMAEEILEIADETSNDTIIKTTQSGESYEVANSEWITRSRLRVDTRKWLMARMAPKKYGDKITQEHQGAGGGALVVEIVRLSDVPNPTA